MPETPVGTGLVALTGATGFIGQHLQQALLDAGYRVRALVRDASARRYAPPPGCETAVVELRDEASVAVALEGVDAVIYAAGSVRGGTFADFEQANVQGVAACVAALSEQGQTAPMLLLSSLAATAPELSFYAGSKAAGEQVLRAGKLSTWSIFQPPAVYGPGDREMRPILNAIRRGLVPLIAPPEQRLPFIEVSDLVAAILAWLRHPDACAGGTFAIHDGTPGGYDWPGIRQLLAPATAVQIRVPQPLLETLGHVNLAMARVAGYAPMLTPGKVRELTYLNWACDNSQFTAATGWRPRLKLAEGVARLFAQ